ncbi:TPA: hypothetical protein N0F65_011219 [Lagenidium giganteum]|uniref:CBM1 domain-containing protein n=1 Tax=Lagenidium giganteum TaxID=4803 RepID=A0AAV2YPG3_9STRA|nr:TPA: hypothetical protein N0F65_011219 [Lagenidium giganteum]
MKVVALLAVTSAVVAAESAAHVHVRVHEHDRGAPQAPPAKEWEQCKWVDRTVPCEKGLQCTNQNTWYGQCVKLEAAVWGQCNGKGWPKPATCPKGNTCVYSNEYYSQCRSGGRRHHHHHRSHHHHDKAGEWEQCLWNDRTVPCNNGLKCVKLNDWYGQCQKDNGGGNNGGNNSNQPVGEWQQCHWKGRDVPCNNGLMCVNDNEWYGKCVKKNADKWGQCYGQGWPEKASCSGGSSCQKINEWYWQCK